MANILVLDNYDSFTYNLTEQFKVLGHQAWVFRNDTPLDILLQSLETHSIQLIVLSPGPGRPEESGCLLEFIHRVKGALPVLGVCLGLQALVLASGGSIGRARHVVHGKASRVQCTPHEIFTELPAIIRVARYHSLVATHVPKPLQVIARYNDEVMAVVDDSNHWVGLQFHPESILTESGNQLLNNIIAWALKGATRVQAQVQPQPQSHVQSQVQTHNQNPRKEKIGSHYESTETPSISSPV